MALKAIRDTFAFEPIAAGVEVRRLIKAGTLVPPSYVRCPEEDVEDDTASSFLVFSGAASMPRPGEMTATGEDETSSSSTEKRSRSR